MLKHKYFGPHYEKGGLFRKRPMLGNLKTMAEDEVVSVTEAMIMNLKTSEVSWRRGWLGVPAVHGVMKSWA